MAGCEQKTRTHTIKGEKKKAKNKFNFEAKGRQDWDNPADERNSWLQTAFLGSRTLEISWIQGDHEQSCSCLSGWRGKHLTHLTHLTCPGSEGALLAHLHTCSFAVIPYLGIAARGQEVSIWRTSQAAYAPPSQSSKQIKFDTAQGIQRVRLLAPSIGW